MPATYETLDVLPGEGETETITRTRLRHECDVCGEPAHFKHTFLLDGARNNPASKAYRKDDCSWCEDESRFACKEHRHDKTAPEGHEWCATFAAVERFSHLFLYWSKPIK